jgi:hypothetical protein
MEVLGMSGPVTDICRQVRPGLSYHVLSMLFREEQLKRSYTCFLVAWVSIRTKELAVEYLLVSEMGITASLLMILKFAKDICRNKH